MTRLERLSPEAYKPYGDVLSAEAARAFREANQGTAKRFDRMAELKNLRPGASPNLSVFRCAPKKLPVDIRVLERHAHSTQVFLPLSQPARYLAAVCLGGDAPDLSTLRAFLIEGPVGISYRPGVWHHPMTALDRETDFACLVWEDGGPGDCELLDLKRPFSLA
ncbi:MAG TPA: ureidoglycolate lyase [Elusimicrobiota bacterium]|jgi:ureidoglycolate lyase|nr:ureidoglycolate lyase [Elusimicrobiota bacterium]